MKTEPDQERRLTIEQAVRMCVSVVIPRIEKNRPMWADHAIGAVMGFLAGRMVSLPDGAKLAAQMARSVLEGRVEKYYFTECRNCGSHPVPLGPYRNCTWCGEGRPLEK